MAVRRRRSKVAINQSLIVDSLIASLIVQMAPNLINRFLFKENPLTGMTSTLAGVGAAYVYGMYMNNSNVSNIGIALGAVEFVKPMVNQLLEQITEDSNGVSDYAQLKDYATLRDYTNDPSKRLTLVNYADSY